MLQNIYENENIDNISTIEFSASVNSNKQPTTALYSSSLDIHCHDNIVTSHAFYNKLKRSAETLSVASRVNS